MVEDRSCRPRTVSLHGSRFAAPLQERNKPIEAPKKPAQAPFFLPTVPGLARDPVFDLEGAEENDAGARCPSATHH